MRKIILFLLMTLILVACASQETALSQDQAPRMTKEDLKARLDTPDLTIIDVRQGDDWTGSDMKIKGAVREEPKRFSEWAAKYPKNRLLVLYCT